jgi:hypothetical protein
MLWLAVPQGMALGFSLPESEVHILHVLHLWASFFTCITVPALEATAANEVLKLDMPLHLSISHAVNASVNLISSQVLDGQERD